MKLLRLLTVLALASLSSFVHAFTVLPVDGLWSVVSEQNLTVGRAFNVEMSDKLVVVTMYTYNAQGAPTFYVGASALSATNTAAIALSEPQGGTCLGCPPTSGRLLSSPGTATFEFTNSTTGFVTLPGEARKAISKGAITRPTGPDSFRGTWALSFIVDSTLTVGDAPSFTVNLAASSTGSGLMASADGKTGCEAQTSGSLVGSVLCVKVTSSTTTDKAMILKMFGDKMDGLWYYRSNLNVPYLFTSHRIANSDGSSLILKRAASEPSASNADFDALRTAIREAASQLAASTE